MPKFKNINSFEFTRSIFLSGGGAAFAQGATLLVTLYLSNSFGAGGLAVFSITQNIVNTLALLMQMGLGYTCVVFAAQYQENDPGYVKAITNFCQSRVLITAVVASAFVAAASHWIASELYGDERLLAYIILACAASPVAASTLVQLSILTGLRKYRSIFFGSMISATLTILSPILGGFYWGVWGAAVGFTLAIFIRAAIFQSFITSASKIVNKSTLSNKQIWNNIRSFAVPAGLAGLTLTPSTLICNAMLLKQDGLFESGLFLSALTLRTAAFFIPQQIASVFLPRYINYGLQDSAGAQKSFLYSTLLMVTITASLALLSFFAGGYILSIFGHGFPKAKNCLDILMLALIFETASLAFNNRLAAQKRMWTMLLMYTWPKDIVLVISAYFYIPVLNGSGLSLAYLISAIYGFFIHLFISKSKKHRY